MLSKKLILIISLLFFFSSTFPLNAATPKDFNDKFVGVNSIHLTDKFTPEKIDTSLSYLTNSCGVSIVRLFLPYTDYPGLSNLKYTLQKGSEYGIKFIITLGDSWRLESGLNFYPGDLETYKQRARDTINRLKNDYGSAVFAWELLNEPHCDYGKITTDADGNSTREFDPTCPNRLYNFVRDFSAEIKQLDPTHPVTIGLIGKHGDGRTSIWSQFDPKTGPYAGSDFVALNNIDTIDAAENHVYSVSMETIQNDIDKANHINKPFFVEEYGPDGIKKSKAEQLKEKMQGSFDYGANGFLVWEYTPIGNDGDQFAFNQNKNNSLCQALKDEAIRQDALPEPYPLEPLGPQPFTPPDNCLLESLNLPPIKINTADPSHPGIAQQSWGGGKHPDKYPPNQEYITLCTNDTEIEQDYSAHKNPETGEVEPYTATEIRKEIKENNFASNLPRLISIFLKPITNLYAPKEQIDQSFTSYGDNFISAGYKMTPANRQNQFKNELIAKAKNGTTLDEQIAWNCSDGCFTLNCGPPSPDCQPVYLSEDNQPCHQLAYQYLNFARSGSSNSKVKVTDNNGETIQNRMLPAGAILTEQNIPLQAISRHQKKATNVICKTVERSATQDTTNPLKFNFFRFISELINKTKTVKSTVKIEEEFDPELQKGSDIQKTFTQNFLPSTNTQELENTTDSGTAGKTNLKSPGGGQLEKDFRKFTDYLHPSSWQNSL